MTLVKELKDEAENFPFEDDISLTPVHHVTAPTVSSLSLHSYGARAAPRRPPGDL